MRFFKRSSTVFLVLAALLAALSGCSRVKDIKVTSFGVEEYSLRGFRSVDATLAVGIDNPAFAFTVSDINGVVKYKGEDFATYKADTVSVQKKSSRVYDLPCSATLSDGLGVLDLISILRKGDIEGFTTDVSAKVRLKSGASKTLRLKNLDLKKLME